MHENVEVGTEGIEVEIVVGGVGVAAVGVVEGVPRTEEEVALVIDWQGGGAEGALEADFLALTLPTPWRW